MLLDLIIGNIPVKLPNPDLLKHFEDYSREYFSTVETQGNTTREVIKQIPLHIDGNSLTVDQSPIFVVENKYLHENPD